MRINLVVMIVILFFNCHGWEFPINDYNIPVTIVMPLWAWLLCCFPFGVMLFLYNVPILFLWACSKNYFKLLNVLLYFSFTANQIDLTWKNNRQSEYDRMQKVGQYYFPILKSACDNNNKELFRYLLDKGASIRPRELVYVLNYDTDFIRICLQSAKHNSDAYRVCQHTNPCICEQFYLCLFHACRFGRKDIVQLLLENNVDIQCSLTNDLGHICDSALTSAMRSFEGIEILGWLLDQGAKKYYLGDNLHDVLENYEKNIQTESNKNKAIESLTSLIGLIAAEKIIFDCPHKCGIHIFESSYNRAITECEAEDKKIKLAHKDLSSLFRTISYGALNHLENYYQFRDLLIKNERYRQYYIAFLVFLDDVKELREINVNKLDIDLIQEAYKYQKRNIITEYFDSNFVNDRGDTLFHIAAQKSLSFLNALVEKCSSDNLKKLLHKKNNENKTWFYVGSEGQALQNMATVCMVLQKCEPCYVNMNEFLHQELCEAATIMECNNLDGFIRFCVQSGAQLNQKNENNNRPVDIAVRRFTKAAQDPDWHSPHFINKEKVMHTFMYYTERIHDKELAWMLYKQGIPVDISRVILSYRNAVQVDYLVANKVISSGDFSYYGKTKQQKEKFKKELLVEVNYKILSSQ